MEIEKTDILKNRTKYIRAAVFLFVTLLSILIFNSISHTVRAQAVPDATLLWQAHSYTPPFYKGKALATAGEEITFVAMPEFRASNGVRIPPESLSYEWSRGSFVLGSRSGTGRRSMTLALESVSRPSSVSVSISTQNGALETKKAVRTGVRPSVVVLYEKHPIEGIRYEKALSGRIPLAQDEITLRAEPYFFSMDDLRLGRVDFRWRANNRPVEVSGASSNEVTFRREGGGGEAQIDVRATNNNLLRALQDAAETLFVDL